MNTIMERIINIAATARVAWDRIPDRVIRRYENEMLILKSLYKGTELKSESIDLYNTIFSQYGYTKPSI